MIYDNSEITSQELEMTLLEPVPIATLPSLEFIHRFSTINIVRNDKASGKSPDPLSHILGIFHCDQVLTDLSVHSLEERFDE